MNKLGMAALAAPTIAATVAATTTSADARWRGGGYRAAITAVAAMASVQASLPGWR
jgi:hypothetical protein